MLTHLQGAEGGLEGRGQAVQAVHVAAEQRLEAPAVAGQAARHHEEEQHLRGSKSITIGRSGSVRQCI